MEETPPFRPEDIALVTGQTAPIDDPDNATVTAGELTTQLTSKADTTYVNSSLTSLSGTLSVALGNKADVVYVDTQLGLKADTTALPNMTLYTPTTELPTLINNTVYGAATRLEALGAATTANITTAWVNQVTEVTHTAAVVLSLDGTMAANTTACIIQIFNNAATTLRISITGLISEGDRVYIRSKGIAFLRYSPTSSIWFLTGALQSGV